MKPTCKPGAVRYNEKYGRVMYHGIHSTSYYWSESMLDYLRRNYATTLNAEIAEHLGMSERTIIRKAREMGLEKDSAWLSSVWQEHVKIGHIVSRCKGYPGTWKKGVHANPDGEWKKGHVLTPEQMAKRSKSLKEWGRTHPEEASERARKAWATRRRKQEMTK